MLCSTHSVLNTLPVFRRLYLTFDYIICRSMSVDINTAVKQDTDEIHVNNKRQIIVEDNEVPSKVQKTHQTDATDPIKRIKRKNYALMLSYLGRDYFGMQRNPGMKTIEEDLVTALSKANLITPEQFENIREISFQRAARTDKGVSASRQVVSLKLPETANKEDINKYLPNEIRVFGIKRVTKGFNSKNQCDGRTYRYIIPTFGFAPEDSSFLEAEELPEDERMKQLLIIDGKPYTEFRLSPDMLDRINAIAKSMEGTHNFHNFTSKTRAQDPRANRYIISFRCTETFIANGIEFAVLEIKGQSFMLHQIRKMVALIIGILRNILNEDIINEVFKPEKFNLPTAPSLGLALNYVHYDNYNKRYGSDGIHGTLDWEECNEEVENFQKEYILKHVIDTEISDTTTLTWLAHFVRPDRFAPKEDVAL